MSKRILIALAIAGFGLSACSPGEEASTAQGEISVTNCGETYTFEQAPERTVLVSATAATTLEALGQLDTVVARAGNFPEEYWDADFNAQIADIPSISDNVDASGHISLSREAVIAHNPDVVIGTADGVDRSTMSAHDVPLIMEEAYCGDFEGGAQWQHLTDHINTYAALYGVQEEGEKYAKELQDRVAEVTAQLPDDGRSVAVLYPTIGGGVTYAYGKGSMTDPIVSAANLENVFADHPDRVFEVSAEQIVQREPDIIVALYVDGTAEAVEQAVRDLQGADAMPAVRDGLIFPMLFNYAEPPNPLNVEGLEKLRDFLVENPA